MLASHERVKKVQIRKQLLGTALPTYHFFLWFWLQFVLVQSENVLKGNQNSHLMHARFEKESLPLHITKKYSDKKI